VNGTIRQYIKRRVRWAAAAGLAGWLLFVMPIWTMAHQSGAPPWAAFAGILLFGGAALVAARTPCPKCSARIGQEIAYRVGLPIFRKPPNFCPYCGVNLDEPMPQREPAPQSQDPIHPP
jgi:hypothetical protein